MLSTSVLDSDRYRAGDKLDPRAASVGCPPSLLLAPLVLAAPLLSAAPLGLAGPRRDPPPSTPQRPAEDRPLTLDDIARTGDAKADESEDGEGQSSTKGTGSAG